MGRRTFLLLLIMLFILPAVFIAAQEFPKPEGYVNDFANIINPAEQSKIEAIARTVEEKTGIEIAVATMPSMEPYGSIEQYSIALATEWGIGKKGKDDGMLLVVALAERKTRIEVGYGLEGIFPDGLVGRIMDTSMVPYFQNNDFSTGLAKAVEGIAGVISEEYDVDFSNISVNESQKYTETTRSSGGISSRYFYFLFFLLIAGGRFLWPLLFLSGASRRRYFRGGFGGSSRGGFGGGGGGFSGFGGGSFGGGGASRGF